MDRLRKKLGFVVLVAVLGTGGMASAQRYYYNPPPRYEPYYSYYSPIAFNVWAGLNADFVGCANCAGPYGSAGFVGANFGGDIGVRLNRHVSLVGMLEYSPLFGDIGTVDTFSLGGGFRFDPSPFAQLLLALTFTETNYSGPDQGGIGAHFYAFFPIGIGFGPYVGLAYRRFYDSTGPAPDIFSLQGGISYSF
jgi:hypothetical protein